MNPWIVLLALFVIALVFVLLPVGTTAFATWRRPVRLACPRTKAEAQLRVAPLRAALASWFGRAARVERCSQWSSVRVCREECLELPEGARRPVAIGAPPPRPDRGPGVHTILVALDGRPGGEAVLPAVADLARAQHATVRLLRVVPPGEAIPSTDGRHMVVFADQDAERHAIASRDYLRTVARRLPGITVLEVVRIGDAATAIVDEAEAAGADLIVLATHCRRGLARFIARSVTRKVRRSTTIPTLVVRYGWGLAA
jgi:nucleotide-binding universal stress UspA family protein